MFRVQGFGLSEGFCQEKRAEAAAQMHSVVSLRATIGFLLFPNRQKQVK